MKSIYPKAIEYAIEQQQKWIKQKEKERETAEKQEDYDFDFDPNLVVDSRYFYTLSKYRVCR